MSNTIPSVKLKGHKGAVLCLEHNSSVLPAGSDVTAGCLLSGSEDRTARLFDLRTGLRASTCILAGGEVNSVAFAPTYASACEGGQFTRNFAVYLGVENRVLGFDLRKADGPIIDLTSGNSNKPLLEAEDEINHIVLSGQKRNQALHLAAADDSGIVQVTDCIDPSAPIISRKRVLHHDKDHLSMVMTNAFRPRSKGLELASGGTDCRILLWDVNKPKKPLSSQKIAADQTGNRNQVCNPPMVNSLSWSPSGRLLAAGLGDGSASIFSVENRSLVEVARLQELGHETPVASVLFPSFLPTSSQDVAAQDRLVATLRNDAVINLWDLGSNAAGERALDPASTLLTSGSDAEKSASAGISLEDLTLFGDKPRLLFGIPHGQKPNWMSSSRGMDSNFPHSLFVADTTNDITVYSIPMR